jgi:iron complex transport system substrate-binding protein
MVDPNLERILALDPQLLIVQGESQLLRAFAVEHGVALRRVDMDRDLASVLDGLDRLDSLLGRTGEPGAAVLRARLERELERVAAAVPAGERPRTLLSLGHDPGALTQLWSMGEGSFLSDLLEIAGGRPAFEEMPPGYFELGLERLLADPPEVVIEVRPGGSLDAEAREAITALWRAQGLDSAVEFVEFEGALIPGPRIAQTARALRDALDRARAESTP